MKKYWDKELECGYISFSDEGRSLSKRIVGEIGIVEVEGNIKYRKKDDKDIRSIIILDFNEKEELIGIEFIGKENAPSSLKG